MAVSNELHHLRRDERDRFGVVEPNPTGHTLLRQKPRLVQYELVEVGRVETHVKG